MSDDNGPYWTVLSSRYPEIFETTIVSADLSDDQPDYLHGGLDDFWRQRFGSELPSPLAAWGRLELYPGFVIVGRSVLGTAWAAQILRERSFCLQAMIDRTGANDYVWTSLSRLHEPVGIGLALSHARSWNRDASPDHPHAYVVPVAVARLQDGQPVYESDLERLHWDLESRLPDVYTDDHRCLPSWNH